MIISIAAGFAAPRLRALRGVLVISSGSHSGSIIALLAISSSDTVKYQHDATFIREMIPTTQKFNVWQLCSGSEEQSNGIYLTAVVVQAGVEASVPI